MRIAFLTGLLLACAGGEAPKVELADGAWTAGELRQLQSMRLDATPRPDPSNRVADDPGAAALGKALFFDAGLSPSGKISCATCHDPAKGFTDHLPISKGVGETARHAPTIPGSQYGPWLYWDGRADSLWAQAAAPLEHPAEMGSTRVFAVRRAQEAHREAYTAVFGPMPDFSDAQRFPLLARPTDEDGAASEAWESMSPADRDLVTGVFVNLTKAIAAYERLLVPTESAFDRYVDAVVAGDAAGGGHLSDAQIAGLSTFMREGNCTACHNGPMLTDRAFHNLGLPMGGKYDEGRASGAAQVLVSEFSCRSRWSDAKECPELTFLDPEFPDFAQAFKTPTLRNVAATAPYMHHGQLADLSAVLKFYSELPGDPTINHRELTLQPLALSESDKQEVIAFLTALSGEPLPDSLVIPEP